MGLQKWKQPLIQHITSPVLAHTAIAPLCQTCGRYCDSFGLVEGEPGETDDDGLLLKSAGTTFFKVLVTHHGSEELGEFDAGGRLWSWDDVNKFIQRRTWFDPVGHFGK